jgi:hypothetical protein
MGCEKKVPLRLIKQISAIEPNLKFITKEQKQRMFVLDKLLESKAVDVKWGSQTYYHVTILKFLQLPKEYIKTIYPRAPIKSFSQAIKEKSPFLKLFDYTALGINSEEWQNFVLSCYKYINDFDKIR